MPHRIVASIVMIVVVATADHGTAQLKKLRTGRTIGELRSMNLAKNKRDTEISVLAPGEENARRYTVNPLQKEVLAELKRAKIGDRVEIDWYDTVEGLCVDKLKLRGKERVPE